MNCLYQWLQFLFTADQQKFAGATFLVNKTNSFRDLSFVKIIKKNGYLSKKNIFNIEKKKNTIAMLTLNTFGEKMKRSRKIASWSLFITASRHTNRKVKDNLFLVILLVLFFIVDLYENIKWLKYNPVNNAQRELTLKYRSSQLVLELATTRSQSRRLFFFKYFLVRYFRYLKIRNTRLRNDATSKDILIIQQFLRFIHSSTTSATLVRYFTDMSSFPQVKNKLMKCSPLGQGDL